MLDFSKPREFDWDDGNIVKNLIKHNISCRESEEVFLDDRLVMLEDEKHSTKEKRYLIIGKNFEGRTLTIVFTNRNKKIRIISARIADKKERRLYEQS